RAGGRGAPLQRRADRVPAGRGQRPQPDPRDQGSGRRGGRGPQAAGGAVRPELRERRGADGCTARPRGDRRRAGGRRSGRARHRLDRTMATQQDIKRRIRSVNNTKKITKAMELVAGSRLRRAQVRIEALRPYADYTQQLMVDVAAAAGQVHDQPLLARREVNRVAVLALTGDRGLAGAFNANVVRRALEIARDHRSEGHEVLWLAVGRRGASTLRFRRQTVEADYTGITDRPDHADAQAIAARVAELYASEQVDQVVMVYNHFISPLAQRLDEVELLPVPEVA